MAVQVGGPDARPGEPLGRGTRRRSRCQSAWNYIYEMLTQILE